MAHEEESHVAPDKAIAYIEQKMEVAADKENESS